MLRGKAFRFMAGASILVGALILVGLMAACAPAAAPAPQAAAPPPSTPTPRPLTAFDRILAGAKAEGKVVYWAGSPGQDKTMEALRDAFNKRFGLNIEIEHVKLNSRDSSSRVIAESGAGRTPGDIIFSSAAQLLDVIKAGAVEKTDWAGVFGKELPGIEKRAETFLPDIKGYALTFHDTSYCLAFNTKLVKKEDLPTRWEDLASPQWKGKFVVDAQGFPFPVLAHDPEWGAEKTEKTVQQLLALDPLIVPASRGEEVARGERPLQTVWFRVARQLQAQGAPVDCVLLNPTPVIPVYLGVAKGAAHPNAARLFLAWLVTEGVQIMDEREYLGGLVTDPASRVGKFVQEGNKRVAVEKTLDDVKRTGAMVRRLSELIAQIRR